MRGRFYGVTINWLGLIALCVLTGCATQGPVARSNRQFDFQRDTLAFPNELVWEYHFDEHGKWTGSPRHPEPDYSHHCFVVARSAKQFFEHARFDATLPVADDATYRRLIRKVVAASPSHEYSDAKRIVFPGYADLRLFSEAKEPLLKIECGGAWQSYFQRGHWRMLLPFSRNERASMAEQLLGDINDNRPPIVHLVRFPQLTINHAVVLYGASADDKEIRFTVYDPNKPDKPGALTFDRATRTFNFPANDYFPGGRVDVYEVYYDTVY
jgi:hypothetical protein